MSTPLTLYKPLATQLTGSEGQILVYRTSANALVFENSGSGGGTTSTNGSQPLYLFPTSSHADDEEFETGTSLPTGWILVDSPAETSPLTLTITTNTPNPYSNPANNTASYAQNTNWRKSWGALQVDAQDRRRVFAKPITASADMFIWSRTIFPVSPLDLTSAGTFGIEVGLFADNGGKPDESNCVFVGAQQPSQRSSAPFYPVVFCDKVVSGVYTAGGVATSYLGAEYFGIQKSGSNYYGHIWSEVGAGISWPALTFTGLVPAWMGWRIIGAPTTQNCPIFRFDFIRRRDTAQGLPY